MLRPLTYLLIVTLFLFFTARLSGQPAGLQIPEEKFLLFKRNLDSLPFYLKKSQVKIYKVCKVNKHDSYFLEKSNITFTAAAINLPDKFRNSYINMYAISELANDFYLEKKYDSATWYWQHALDTAIAFGFEAEELHSLRMSLNNNCFLKGDYTVAMKISTEGLAKSERLQDVNRMAHFNNVIGYIYMKLRDTAKAGFYFHNQLKNAKSINDSFGVAHALYNLGDLSITEKKYDEAIGYFTLALNAYAVLNGAVYYFSNKERNALVSNKLAQCWKLKGDLIKAFQFIQPSLEATKMATSVNPYDKADFLVNAGDIYSRMQKKDSALLFLREGIQIASDINHREFKRDAYEQLAIVFSGKEMYDSAFFYQQLYSKLKDSIANEISNEEIYQRDTDLQIERQQQLQRIALEKQKFLRNIIIGVGVLLLIIVVFQYNRYQLRQKNKYQQELNRQQNELFNAIAAAQDQERKRIAQDIHDSLGSILSAAKLKLSSIKDSQPILTDEHSEKYKTAMNLLDEASAELRSISHNIMPATLSKLGLIAALKNLTGTISSHSGLQIYFTSHDFTERIPEQMEMSIYRIILELLNNIVKHAGADKVTIQLIKYPDHINVSVEDNGKGFDYSLALQEKKGIGLGNILSRVDYLNGTINVDAVSGRGTTVIIEVPTGLEKV